MAVTAPPQGGGRSQMMVRSIVPLALVYLLLTAALITGGMMLQGVIEERSNRLLEAVLACVEPRELMDGKLIGLGAVGLTIMLHSGSVAPCWPPFPSKAWSPIICARRWRR